MALRNPFVAFVLSIAETGLLAPLAALPSLAFPMLGLHPAALVVSLVAAFSVLGAVVGRVGTLPPVAFVGSFLGAFVGFAAFSFLLAPSGLLEFAVLGAVAGVSAWTSAVWQGAYEPRQIRALESAEKRQCRLCGARVGAAARRCWSCRASLSRIT